MGGYFAELVAKAGLTSLDYILTGIVFALFGGNLKLEAIKQRDANNNLIAAICDAFGDLSGCISVSAFINSHLSLSTTSHSDSEPVIEDRKVDYQTGEGYDASDEPVRIESEWSISDLKQALLGHPPRDLCKPDIHHGGQMPGGARHEILPYQHRNNPALHPNIYNQGVTDIMRTEDRELHWWYRAREQGAVYLLPECIYD